MQEVQAVCDNVIIINKGKIVANNTTANLQNMLSHEILVEVEFANEITEAELNKIQNIHAVEKISASHFILHGKESTQLRKDIFAFAVAKNNPLLTLKQESKSLEDIFHQLTTTKQS
jgi:ABC-2 type transport system ATP-binding protein